MVNADWLASRRLLASFAFFLVPSLRALSPAKATGCLEFVKRSAGRDMQNLGTVDVEFRIAGPQTLQVHASSQTHAVIDPQKATTPSAASIGSSRDGQLSFENQLILTDYKR
jgi:hypothetical protein